MAHNTSKQKTDRAEKMKLVHIIPISRGVGKEQLTYFTSRDVAAGSMVSVQIRNKQAGAIVISVEDAHMSKSQIKSAPYAIKKMGAVKAGSFISTAFVNASQKTAVYFAATTGSVLASLIPAAIYNAPKELFRATKIKPGKEKKGASDNNTKQQLHLVQADDKERISAYKSIIREEFAKGSSVFFCLPEISEIEHITKILSRGIEDYTYIFHGSMAKKHIIGSWSKALKETHPILIIATGQFLSIPREDITTIILEKESARSYKQTARPYLDIRTFAEILARESGAKLIAGDIFLRPETIFRQKEGSAVELSPLKFRSLSTAKQHVVNMKEYTNTAKLKKMPIISDELRSILNRHKENENTFILTARRGLYPTTVCNDCGNTVLCDRCSAPTVLHKTAGGKEKNTAFCHKCGLKQKASDRCSMCGGWRLATLGVGIEYAEEELRKEFPDLLIFRMDKDSISTHKRAMEMMDKFYATPGSVMLGTEMAISYLNKEIDNAAVISVDSLFTIPDFRINERVFNILLRLRERAAKNFIIQTRDIENRIFDYAARGNMMDFYREEIAERKILKYPPFVKLVKITLEGGKQTVEKEMSILEDKLSEYAPAVFPAFIATVKGRYRMNLLLKLPVGEWKDEKMLNILQSLPPSFAVRVDPMDVL